jgi:hypothetical protein
LLDIRDLAKGTKKEAEDPVNGTLFAPAPKKLSGAQGVQRSAVVHFLAFADFCSDIGATYPSLDEFFRAWGRRSVIPQHQFSTLNEVEKCTAERQAQNTTLKEMSGD